MSTDPQSTDQKSSPQLALTPRCRVMTDRLQMWKKGFVKRLINNQNINLYGKHGRITQVDGTTLRAE